jgi:hypothetical protein
MSTPTRSFPGRDNIVNVPCPRGSRAKSPAPSVRSAALGKRPTDAGRRAGHDRVLGSSFVSIGIGPTSLGGAAGRSYRLTTDGQPRAASNRSTVRGVLSDSHGWTHGQGTRDG